MINKNREQMLGGFLVSGLEKDKCPNVNVGDLEAQFYTGKGKKMTLDQEAEARFCAKLFGV